MSDDAVARAVSVEVVDESIDLVMSTVEARRCISEIKDTVNRIRALLLALDKRRGWEALGYDSMRQCLLSEFKNSQVSLNYLYRELKAGKIESRLLPRGNIGTIPEKHLRYLGKLPAEIWSSAWNEVVSTCPPKGVTTRHVSQVVERLLEQTEEEFSIGDQVEVRSAGTWYGMTGLITKVEESEITVQLNEVNWQNLRFKREDLVKILPFGQPPAEKDAFYKAGDLLIVDCPANVQCEYKRFNGCWTIVNEIGELGSIQVQLAGKTMRVKKSDTEPVDNPPAQLLDVASKVTALLEREDLDVFERRFLEMYLREQSFSEKQIKLLNQIYSDYYEANYQ